MCVGTACRLSETCVRLNVCACVLQLAGYQRLLLPACGSLEILVGYVTGYVIE